MMRGFYPERAYVLMELCMEGVLSYLLQPRPSFYPGETLHACTGASHALYSISMHTVTWQHHWQCARIAS